MTTRTAMRRPLQQTANGFTRHYTNGWAFKQQFSQQHMRKADMRYAVITNVWENNGLFHGIGLEEGRWEIWRLTGEITLDVIILCHETYIT